MNSVMKLQKVTKKPDKNVEKGILINAHIDPMNMNIKYQRRNRII